MDSTLISTRPDEGTLSLSRARRAALGSFAGAVVDWYDFLLYGITAALVFNREFFPQVSPAMGTLAAFATFGVGFLFRPLGGVIFGHFGDRLGRKRMLMLTVWMMGIATALIGILPSFSTIGWWAPILLVTLRAIQGFAVGGEWGGAALLSVESAPKNKKAFYSSGVQVGYGVGLLLSTGLVSLISMMTTDEQFLSWGWQTLRMTWWCVCNNRCLPKCLVPVIATVVLESVIRLPVWLAVDLHLLLPLHSSLTLPGTGIASPFICWLDA